MRSLVALLTLLAAGLVAVSGADDPNCRLTVELLDAQTGRRTPGLLQIRDAAGMLVPLPSLMSRGFGLEPRGPIHDWSVVVDRVRLSLPRGRYVLRAFSGLETETTETTIELAGPQAAVDLPLRRFFDAAAAGYRSANTHLHLKKLSREQADRYLIETPRADGLDVVFLSYLERAVDDLEYTSNHYTGADLRRLSRHGATYGNGEEHRHNFVPQNQGYGHVMLLNIPELIQPVSIGPGITRKGTDGPSLRVGIDKARSFGSTIIWCHNQWGLEDIPNWVMGRLHANNIFDGGTQGSYKHSFYRYLNAGLRVPFSTGTDWFIYDFSRVYVPADRPLSAEEWLATLASGRSWITNGPLLEFRVDGKTLGDTLALDRPRAVRIESRAAGRVDFQRIELIRNGEVVRRAESRAEAGHFVATLDLELPIDEPCWLALRTPPPSIKGDPEFQTKTPRNELDGELFSHTSAVFVEVDGAARFDVAAAESLVQEMRDNRRLVLDRAIFADDQERDRVLATYDEAIERLDRKAKAK